MTEEIKFEGWRDLDVPWQPTEEQVKCLADHIDAQATKFAKRTCGLYDSHLGAIEA